MRTLTHFFTCIKSGDIFKKKRKEKKIRSVATLRLGHLKRVMRTTYNFIRTYVTEKNRRTINSTPAF